MPTKEKPIAEKEIAFMMASLACSREDAIDVIESDRAIDRGERVYFDLSKEDEKAAIKEANKNAARAPTVYNFTKRERKPNATKGGLIEELARFLSEQSDYAEGVEIVNKEREIAFKCGTNSFSITLTQHRAKK